MAQNSRFFIHSVFSSLRFASRRVAVIFIAIFIGAAVSAAFLNLYFDTNSKMSKELKAYGANLVVSPKNDEIFIDTNAVYGAFSRVDKAHLLSYTPYLYGFFSLGSSSGVVAGVDFSGFRKSKPLIQIQKGSFGVKDFCDKCAFLGVNIAKSLEAKIGETIEITNPKNQKMDKFIVKAIFSLGDESDDIVYIDLKQAQNLLGDGDVINYADAVINGSFDEISQIAASLSSDKINAKPLARVSLAQGAILDKIKALMALISVIVLVISSTSVNTTLSSIIFSRRKEIALNLSLGATNGDIVRLFGYEICILTLIASILGAFGGYLLSQLLGFLIFNSGINFRIMSIILAVLISVLCSAIAAIYPIKQALHVNLAQNLRGE